MHILIKLFLMSLAIMISAYLIPGVTLTGVWAALWLAVFLAIVNILIKPLLLVITLPINILTLGLFTFVVNGLMIMLASSVVKGFSVSGIWVAILFSIILSIVSYSLNALMLKK
jgi:putative membrane protein